MSEVTTSFPEYSRAHLSDDCRSHLLGAAGCWKAAHEALLRDDKRIALIQLDKCIAIACEARKFLLTEGQPIVTPPAVENTAPMRCKHGTFLDIPCVECIQEKEAEVK